MMPSDEQVERVKQQMRYKIDVASANLPDLSNCSKSEVMEVVLGVAYMMIIELLEDQRQSWSLAQRAHSAYFYRELVKDLMKQWPEFQL